MGSGSVQEMEFSHAKEGTIYNRLYERKMQAEESAFVSPVKGIELVLSEDTYAYFNIYEMLVQTVDRSGHNCKVFNCCLLLF